MKVAILEHLLRVPEAGIFATARELGFDGVELTIGGYGSERKALYQPDGPTILRQRADEQGMAICSISVGYLHRFGLVDPRSEVRQKAIEVVGQLIEACSRAAIPLLHLPFFGASEIKDRTAERLAVDVLQPLAAQAASQHVTIGLEILWPADRLKELVERFRSPVVKVYYDPANARAAGRDVIAEIKLLGGLIGQLHVKDRDRHEPFAGAAIGEGIIDYKSLLKTLAKTGYDGWLVLDTPSGEEPLAAARRNREALARLLKS